MVRAFVQHLNRKYRKARSELDIRFELLPVSSDQLIPQLLEGRGDMIAARLTITPLRKNLVRFSIPYRTVDEVVVTSLEPLPFQKLEDLAGYRFAVRESSSYHDSLLVFNRRLRSKGLGPVEILTVPKAIETEAILQRVALGEYEFTVVDSLLSESAAAVFERLTVLPGFADLSAAKQGRVYVVDANAYFTRSSPRLVDSLELLAGLLHPTRFPGLVDRVGAPWAVLT